MENNKEFNRDPNTLPQETTGTAATGEPDQAKNKETAEKGKPNASSTSDCTGSCDCQGSCSCDKNKDEKRGMKDKTAVEDTEGARSFFDELQQLADKYGARVVGSGMVGHIYPFSVHHPKCANADSCEDAKDCPWAQAFDDHTESDTTGKSSYVDDEFGIIIDILSSIASRLDRIEQHLNVEANPRIISDIRLEPAKLKKYKGFRIRKKDMRRIHREFIDLRGAISAMLDRATLDLKETITDATGQPVATTQQVPQISDTRFYTGDSTRHERIEMPGPDWTINDWVNFQKQITQFILSEKARNSFFENLGKPGKKK